MMKSLISLTLLAFIAGTLVLVAATKKGKGRNITITDTDFDADRSQCPDQAPDQCSYRNRSSCSCKPPMHVYTRLPRYFYLPRLNKCLKFPSLGYGCNSFENIQECSDKCEQGRRPGRKSRESRHKPN
uniref:Putative secreted protein n=1 Tax=Amblyomma americanum TaxID=6943 RepID=A0A0C9RWT6_AMBAM